MIVAELFDWAFFTLYFSIGLLTLCAQVVHFSFAGDLPDWASGPKGQLVLALLFLPLGYLEDVVLIYGFLILPWYTVVICAVAEIIAGGLVYGALFQPITRWFGTIHSFVACPSDCYHSDRLVLRVYSRVADI
jgi:hypothetical protein